MKDFNSYLQNLTEEELKTLDNFISSEKKRREEKTRLELIGNFRKAFTEIRKAGIEISISDSCCSIVDEIYISNFDDFNFY